MWPVCLLLVAGWTAPDDAVAEEPELPVVGRPPDLPFSGASGRFRAEARAHPTQLRAGQPLTLTLVVQATGPVQHAPGPIDLNQVPAVTDLFYVEGSANPSNPAGAKDPAKRVWEFSYSLKPRRADVNEVPGIPFVFFDPAIKPASRGYQVLYTEAIPLTVGPPEKVQVPIQAPEEFFDLARGPALLASQTPWTLPAPGTMATLLLIPPTLGLIAYTVWGRLYPDAARLARRRRSRAARLALRALSGLRRRPVHDQAEHVVQAVRDYLRQRLDLPPGQTTPAEADIHLRRLGLADELSERVSGLLRLCDEVRFGPGNGQPADLTARAAEVILAVESAT